MIRQCMRRPLAVAHRQTSGRRLCASSLMRSGRVAASVVAVDRRSDQQWRRSSDVASHLQRGLSTAVVEEDEVDADV